MRLFRSRKSSINGGPLTKELTVYQHLEQAGITIGQFDHAKGNNVLMFGTTNVFRMQWICLSHRISILDRGRGENWGKSETSITFQRPIRSTGSRPRSGSRGGISCVSLHLGELCTVFTVNPLLIHSFIHSISLSVAPQHEVPLCGVCTFSSSLCGFSPGDPAPSHQPKTSG